MKHLKIFIFIPFLLSGCNQTYEPKELDTNKTYEDVYLIMGQSNASGCSQQKYLETKDSEIYQKYTQGNSHVLLSYDCDDHIQKDFVPTKFGTGNTEDFFGPEIGIAETLNQKEATQYIIKASWSGSCLQNQYVNKDGKKLRLYKRYISFIKGQLKSLEKQGKNPRLRGVFWMQGESDSFLLSYDYKVASKYFFDYLRTDLNKWIYEYFNIVDAYIYTRGICWTEPEIINTCKQQLADENEHWYCIKTNGEDNSAITLNLKSDCGEGEDLAHYDSLSMVLLGKTAGEYLLK